MSGALKYTLVVRHPDTDEPTALLAGQPVPDWAADLVHNDDLDGVDGVEDSGDTVGWAKAKVDEMAAEVARRNEGREESERIVVGGKGNKPDLIAALTDDDAKLAAAGA